MRVIRPAFFISEVIQNKYSIVYFLGMVIIDKSNEDGQGIVNFDMCVLNARARKLSIISYNGK